MVLQQALLGMALPSPSHRPQVKGWITTNSTAAAAAVF
jgi:hypothetical protein